MAPNFGGRKPWWISLSTCQSIILADLLCKQSNNTFFYQNVIGQQFTQVFYGQSFVGHGSNPESHFTTVISNSCIKRQHKRNNCVCFQIMKAKLYPQANTKFVTIQLYLILLWYTTTYHIFITSIIRTCSLTLSIQGKDCLDCYVNTLELVLFKH